MSPAAAIPLRENGFDHNVYKNHEDFRNQCAANRHSDIISEISYVYHLCSAGISNGESHYSNDVTQRLLSASLDTN